MTLTKVLTATAILATSGAASADFIGLHIGAESWNYDMDGYISSGNENIDLNQDLGLKDDDGSIYHIAFEHPVPFLPNVKLQKNNLDGSAIGNATQTFTFNDVTFVEGSELASRYDLTHTDYTLYYELLDNWVNLDLGLTGKDFDGSMEVNYTATTGTVGSRLDLKGTVPAVYGKAQFDLPFTGLSTGATFNIGEKSGDKISDIKAYLAYEGDSGIGLELGYRTFDVEFDDFDSLSSDITIDGFYAGFTLHL
ncbi:TIGR04219 family outer membrane beta-barrel protein [Kangiella shandongensis]|uniref:TIGR04219 family outer membrane beta-barrel protein n=1 Tax=Kangiella shandongensis TaxID=2763258 RepID=UPI001CC064D8|nr:TIGR04219 family outer membrane beta-barrel protein [Kangiella shandongensis]